MRTVDRIHGGSVRDRVLRVVLEGCLGHAVVGTPGHVLFAVLAVRIECSVNGDVGQGVGRGWFLASPDVVCVAEALEHAADTVCRGDEVVFTDSVSSGDRRDDLCDGAAVDDINGLIRKHGVGYTCGVRVCHVVDDNINR